MSTSASRLGPDLGAVWATPTEVANTLGVSRRTVLRLCRDGLLPSVKLGKAVRLPPDWQRALKTTGVMDGRERREPARRNEKDRAT